MLSERRYNLWLGFNHKVQNLKGTFVYLIYLYMGDISTSMVHISTLKVHIST